MGVSKTSGKKLKMDGLFHGSKPYFLMDDLGGKHPPLFLVQHPYMHPLTSSPLEPWA